jgi:hypothetical protein
VEGSEERLSSWAKGSCSCLRCRAISCKFTKPTRLPRFNSLTLSKGVTAGDGPPSGPKKAEPVVDMPAWTRLSTPLAPFKGGTPSHIAFGSACTHTDPPPFMGRVKVASSISDLEVAISDGDSLTVALSSADETAREEVLAYAVQRSIMTVRRVEGQCIGCAVQLGHCVGALIVIA